MKIGITGHSKGLGAELAEYYSSQGHDVLGWSRSNGFDLNNTLPIVAKQCEECDIIFNNAPGYFQYELFQLLAGSAKLQNNHSVIVNISSLASRFGVSQSMAYAAHKAALDTATLSYQLWGSRWPAALLIRPGYFTGERSAHKKVQHVDVHAVMHTIINAVEAAYNDRYRINEITIVR
jgi:NAD(P)-dependent dehydrogenase (short-subunit alcohol dehydrogenase family)